MSLTFSLPPSYAVEDRLTLDEKEPTRWFSKFLLGVESCGMLSLLEDRDPKDNSVLNHLANSRLNIATANWLILNPKPDRGEDTVAEWTRARYSFQKERLESLQLTLLQEWSSAAKLWMQNALHDEVWRVINSQPGTDTAAGIFKVIQEHCHAATPQKNSYYAFERIFTLKYRREQGTFDTHVAVLKTRIHEWMTCMRPPTDLSGPEVNNWYKERITMGALALSVEQDPELHSLSNTMQATKPELKALELEAALKAAAHTRDEASAHGDNTGSADPPSVRANVAGTAHVRTAQRRFCDYCYLDTHAPAQCPTLVVDNHEGRVRAGYTVPKHLMKYATLIHRTNTTQNRRGPSHDRGASQARGKSQQRDSRHRAKSTGRPSSIRFARSRSGHHTSRDRSRSRSTFRGRPYGRDSAKSGPYDRCDDRDNLRYHRDFDDDDEVAGSGWRRGGNSGTRYERTHASSGNRHFMDETRGRTSSTRDRRYDDADPRSPSRSHDHYGDEDRSRPRERRDRRSMSRSRSPTHRGRHYGYCDHHRSTRSALRSRSRPRSRSHPRPAEDRGTARGRSRTPSLTRADSGDSPRYEAAPEQPMAMSSQTTEPGEIFLQQDNRVFASNTTPLLLKRPSSVYLPRVYVLHIPELNTYALKITHGMGQDPNIENRPAKVHDIQVPPSSLTKYTWIIDSGCTLSSTCDKHWFIDFHPTTGSITVGNGATLQIKGYGTVKLETNIYRGSRYDPKADFIVSSFLMTEVLYCPDLKFNLLSISQGLQEGFDFQFPAVNRCQIISPGKDWYMMAPHDRKTALFCLNCCYSTTPSLDREALHASVMSSDYESLFKAFHKLWKSWFNNPNIDTNLGGALHPVYRRPPNQSGIYDVSSHNCGT